MRITGTFLDEISHDIPHQNWGREEWDADFRAMKAFGINTVILIRCGWKRWMTFPSDVLKKEKDGFEPPIDLIDMYLDLAEKYDMNFFCGSYDSGIPWWRPEYDAAPDAEIMCKVCNEIIDRYGKRKAFKGWYLSQEIGGSNAKVAGIYRAMAETIKTRMPGAKIMISPGMQGAKAYNEKMEKLGVTIAPELHEAHWREQMARIKGVVDIVAFQDGHVEIELLPTFLKINKKLCDENGIECWTNSESFDRDMPIDFLPIKWEKLRLKLKAAEEAGLSNAITFEFSHFISPNSMYKSAGGLYDRYCEEMGIPARAKDFR
ncbi:MAG: DUF4434 domain-containing protein [Lentisphaerae bacterium]|nr:DUF4434 domain-containing protein [Lentisphaerota bacterium]